MTADELRGLGLLGDQNRRLILELLGQSPSSVRDLADQLPITRPGVSQHLMLLKAAGLVSSHSEGTRHIYRVDESGVEALLTALERAAFPWPTLRSGPPHATSDEARDEEPALMLIGGAEVRASADTAFATFTTHLDSWWPRNFSLGAADVGRMVLEGGRSGRWYQEGASGQRHPWGRIVAWEAPRRLVVSWELDGRWRPLRDPERASLVDVCVVDHGTTSVVHVKHSHFERVPEGRAMYAAMAARDTWNALLRRFARLAEQRRTTG